MRKPYGVWMILRDGGAWMFSREKTLTDALATAVVLRGISPLFSYYRVWIAAPGPPTVIRRSR